MIRRHALAGAIGLVLAGAFAFAGIALHPTPHRSRPPRPEVTGAYFHGGVPAYDPELEAALAAGAGDFIALGPIAQLRERGRAASDRFAELGLGYYLRGDVLPGGREIVFAFRVERVAFERIGGEAHRVLELRRIDRQNIAHASLGLEAFDLGDPIVLLDQIDELIESHVDVALRDGFYPMEGDDLGFAAGAAIRRELAGRDPAEIRRLVIASVRRHEARHDYDADHDPPRDRVHAELSAYLSQIANDPVTPQLALWNLASLAQRRGTTEAKVGAIVLVGLAGNEPERALASLSDDELRARARALWLRLYGEPCANMVDAW